MLSFSVLLKHKTYKKENRVKDFLIVIALYCPNYRIKETKIGCRNSLILGLSPKLKYQLLISRPGSTWNRCSLGTGKLSSIGHQFEHLKCSFMFEKSHKIKQTVIHEIVFMSIITPIKLGLMIHVLNLLYNVTTQDMLNIVIFDI